MPSERRFSMEEDSKQKINLKLKSILEWGYCILIAVALALLIRYYVGTPTVVQQVSMFDTLVQNERLLLNRWQRTINGEYKRGDIITFEEPSKVRLTAFDIDTKNPVAEYNNEPKTIWGKLSYYVFEFSKRSYIKRVIGLPGENIKIEEGKVYINGTLLEEPYLDSDVITEGKNYGDITVPEGYVFAMGDNRENSTDSREFGCIPIQKIESKVWIRFWPLSKFGPVE